MFGYCLRLVLLVDLVAASALRLIRCAWWLISVCFRMMRVSCDFLFIYSCGVYCLAVVLAAGGFGCCLFGLVASG